MLTLLNVMLPASDPTAALHFQCVKAQINAGDGACFPMHFDSDATLDARKITALTYLNPDRAEGDGGELVLYPFPAPPVKIEPLGGEGRALSPPSTRSTGFSRARREGCASPPGSSRNARAPEGGGGPVPVPDDGGDAARKVVREAAATKAGEEAARGRVEGEDDPRRRSCVSRFGPGPCVGTWPRLCTRGSGLRPSRTRTRTRPRARGGAGDALEGGGGHRAGARASRAEGDGGGGEGGWERYRGSA